MIWLTLRSIEISSWPGQEDTYSAYPDRSNFLIATFVHRDDSMPLWIWPVEGGAPKRIGEVIAYDGTWQPNGRSILYSEDDGIYQANLDGTNIRRFVATEGHARFFGWSPDGHILRFTVYNEGHGSTIWQINSDGSHLHTFAPGWEDVPKECCGTWSPDGEYFFFQSSHSSTQQDIWVIREKPALFHHGSVKSVRLTCGPTHYETPVLSPDGRKLFVLGEGGRGELVRYELQSRRFIPWLPQVSAFRWRFQLTVRRWRTRRRPTRLWCASMWMGHSRWS